MKDSSLNNAKAAIRSV